MGLWDVLNEALADARKAAAQETGRIAARSAADRLIARAESLLDGTLSEAEDALADAEAARSGRDDVRPDPTSADDLEAKIRGAAESVEEAGDAYRARQRASREEAARAELERIKAELRARRGS